MKTLVSFDELRKNLTEIAGQVMYGNTKVRVRKYNRQGMILMSEEEYDRLEKMLNPRKRFTESEWEKGFFIMDKMRENAKQFKTPEIESTIGNVINDVRRKKHG